MADDITLGEVLRIAKDNARKIENLPERYVLREVYQNDQRNTDRRIVDLVADVGKTDGKVESLEKEQAMLEKERQNAAAARRWQLFLLVAGPILATLVSLLVFQGQTP